MKRTAILLMALAMLFLSAVAGCSNDSENVVTEAAVEAEDTAEALDDTSEDAELKAEAELTADSMLAAMQEYMENASSMTMDMSFTMDMTIDGERVITDIRYTYQVTSAPEAAHVSVTVTYEADYEEESMVTTTESYVVQEDGVYVTYSGVDGEWYKMEIELDVDLMESYSMLDMATDCTLAEETQTVNGAECYVLICQIQGDDLQTLMDEMGLTSLTGDMDYSALTVEESIWLDTETLFPVQVTVDFGDSLTAVMEASIDLTEEDGIDFSMEPCMIMVNYTGFNNVDEIIVPEEVIESAASYDALYESYSSDYELTFKEDGTYLLEDGYTDGGVNLAAPMGHTIDESSSDSTWICFDADTSDDEYAYVFYSLYTDFTAEDMEYIYRDSFDDYADYYDDAVITELQTVTIDGQNVTYVAVLCSYDDNSQEMEFYAWTELSENVFLLIGGVDYAYGREIQIYSDLPTLLETLIDAIQ